MKTLLPVSVLFCIWLGSCTNRATYKHLDATAYVQFTSPRQAASKRSLFQLPSMAEAEAVFENKLAMELHAGTARISHYNDTARMPWIPDSVIYPVCRADISFDTLPRWTGGFSIAKKVARALCHLYYGKVPEAYFDQLYICFSAKAEPDSLRLYVFSNAHGTKPPLPAQNDSNVNCKGIAVDPEQWYLTTWILMPNKK